ncbi:ISPsy5, Orf1 [Pseudomonas syringae pv. actinidiae ICMP 18807]|uniref:ISPsy5, Orf1 n=1 Tax=Pseudomonas syringae pv. actinidiae ICMP 18807 TaxID=1194404 RepID=S6VB52_PSESF|nr:ISPsy5, Orf1 [Pseudomonas syringae pv. actinidiae ICMP 18807]
MMRPDTKVEKVYLYPKPVDFRKSIDGLAERNGFCLWLKRLESERFKTSPDETDQAIVLTVQELNWLLDGFDLWRNRPHKVLTPRFVA